MRSPEHRPKKRWPKSPPRPRKSRLGAFTHGLGAFLVSAAFFATLALGMLYVRLNEGPISLGPLADIVVQRLNADGARQRFEVADVVLALGKEGENSGLRLRDVKVLDADGGAIARAPEIGVRFRAWDAMRGDLAPTQIRLDGTEATLRRNADGGFSFKFAEPAAADAGGASFFDLLRSAERDEGVLRKLRRVEARNVTLTYDDRATGQSWTAGGVNMAVWRLGGRLYGSLTVRADLGAGKLVNLTLTGNRPLTSDVTTLAASFSGADGPDIGGQIPALSWLDGVHAPISGALSLKLGDNGELFELSGQLEVGAGEAVSGDGARTAIRSAALSMDYDAQDDRFDIRKAQVNTAALSVAAEGVADLVRDAHGGIEGLVLQTTIRDVALAPPGVFASPLEFDDGKVTARVRFEPLRIELGEARLVHGQTNFTFSGSFFRRDEAWRTDVKFGARMLPATELVAYWPERAAPDARDWTARNIRAGMIETISGFARIGDGAPQFALNFTHRDIEAHAVAGMSPIIGARGTGHLDPGRFVITVDDGDVELGEGKVIGLDGSSFLLPDIQTFPAPARATLKARGRVLDILDLIDQEPLRLTSKFGADLSRIEGDAVVTADLSFPLLKFLNPSDVDVTASAKIANVRYPTPFGGLVASSPALDLKATPRELEVDGPITIGGFTGNFSWRERLQRNGVDTSGPRTVMQLATRLDAPTLKRIGLEAITISKGHAPVMLTLTADDGTPLLMALTADLGPARLAAPGLGFSKGEGPGSVAARGVIQDGLRITALTVATPDIAIEGSASLGPALELRSADLEKFEVGGHTALSIGLIQEAESRTLDVKGRKLDLAWLTSLNSGGASPTPMTAKVAVERLRLTEDLTLRDATGDVATVDGATEAKISGKVNGGKIARFGYASASGGGGKLRIDAANAGDFLRDLGYFSNGYGGVLALDATLGPGGVGQVDGELAIDGIVARDAPALAKMLSIASLIGLFDQLQSGGISFSRVRVPFKVRDGRITMDEATATGPNIGLKMDGGYETGRDRIDMTGVLTPAYAVNAALANVPLIGDVLGGAGEGVFAFTFSVKGSKDAPQVSVNPLSVLTPGILRNIFSGGGGGGGGDGGQAEVRPKSPTVKAERYDK
jgi:hypothetical protein